jgi:hypothetical protein
MGVKKIIYIYRVSKNNIYITFYGVSKILHILYFIGCPKIMYILYFIGCPKSKIKIVFDRYRPMANHRHCFILLKKKTLNGDFSLKRHLKRKESNYFEHPPISNYKLLKRNYF